MVAVDLSGKHALVMGVANHRSLAWAIARSLHQAGATLCLSYAGERLKSSVEELAASVPGSLVLECDVTRDETIDAVARTLESRWGSVELLVHGIAFARREDLEGSFVATSREGFQTALEVSAYSLLNVTNRLLPLLERRGASIVTLSYLAAERAVPSYNVMGSAKAVLEQSVRQLAYELGPKGIRVNALSAGPVSTLAARGVRGFTDMLKKHAERAPLKRNITQDDVGKAGLFLLSDLASGVTGEVVMVDGGYSIVAW
ncbi:MAG: enoyl-ACP reductase [Candidatus Eisenbacteria bacterium]|uniref:Enoyl-[acyl-carrier-protein] reductase [NADH] n=1 Tax=Eiseniibacteriota bacterium TaxID=2212470 RepID=A0A538TU25_UNCEI|nr:MAG: enoyl-ACP reductase [Candidatus Eisenbacteria bacterium]